MLSEVVRWEVSWTAIWEVSEVEIVEISLFPAAVIDEMGISKWNKSLLVEGDAIVEWCGGDKEVE